MTMTLRRQLGLWFGSALICVATFQGVRALAAPEERLSAEEVSCRFALWLDNSDGRPKIDVSYLICDKDRQTLTFDQINELATQLSQSYASSVYDARKISEKSGGAVVRVIPLKERPAKEFICVQEKGGYKIDLVATYGRWNKLGGAALARQVYNLSGGILPTLPRNSITDSNMCQSNLKQIALGLAMYSQDYDERLPPARDWGAGLEPYLKNNKLYTCPAVRPKQFGYAYNVANSAVYLEQISEDEVSRAVTFFDSQKLSANAVGGQQDISNRHKLPSGAGANVAFVDGHIKFIGASYKWNDNRFIFKPKLGPVPIYDPNQPPGPPVP